MKSCPPIWQIRLEVSPKNTLCRFQHAVIFGYCQCFNSTNTGRKFYTAELFTKKAHVCLEFGVHTLTHSHTHTHTTHTHTQHTHTHTDTDTHTHTDTPPHTQTHPHNTPTHTHTQHTHTHTVGHNNQNPDRQLILLSDIYLDL